MYTRIEVNVETGETVEVQLSASESAEIDALKAAPPPVPDSVHMRQARLALFYAGVLDQVNAAVAKAPPPDQIWWEYSTDVHRDHPLVIEITKTLGMTPEQVDQLFISAAAQP